jgi:hypothetical protein
VAKVFAGNFLNCFAAGAPAKIERASASFTRIFPIGSSVKRVDIFSHEARQRNPSRLSARARWNEALCAKARTVLNFGVYGARKV